MPDDKKTAQLLSKIREGDEEAFAALSEQYRPLAESMAVRYAAKADTDDGLVSPDDFRQEAGFALYRAAMTYNGEQTAVSFGLYAKTCIRNALVSLLRRTSHARKTRTAALRAASSEKRPAESPLARLLTAEKKSSFVRQAAEVLSPYEMTIFEQYIAGKPPREIAERIGRPVKSVNNAVYRIKAKLKGLLRDSK